MDKVDRFFGCWVPPLVLPFPTISLVLVEEGNLPKGEGLLEGLKGACCRVAGLKVGM